MGLYARHVLPRLTHLSMSQAALRPYRERLVAPARGRVLEIGAGSGLNFACYGEAVDEVIAVDASAGLMARARTAAASAPVTVRLLHLDAQALALAAGSVDTAVVSWALCSIADPVAALREVRQALRPGGSLLFVEHGAAPDPGVRAWQDRLTPLWRRLGGGCHLNRPIADLVREAGFEITALDTAYASGPRPLSYFYEGAARA